MKKTNALTVDLKILKNFASAISQEDDSNGIIQSARRAIEKTIEDKEAMMQFEEHKKKCIKLINSTIKTQQKIMKITEQSKSKTLSQFQIS